MILTTVFNNSLPGFIEIDEIHHEHGRAVIYQRFNNCSGFERYYCAKILTNPNVVSKNKENCYSFVSLEDIREKVENILESAFLVNKDEKMIEYDVPVNLEELTPFPGLRA